MRSPVRCAFSRNRPASSSGPSRFTGVSPARRPDRVEAALRHADATLEDWFRQGRKTTRKASVDLVRLLRRSKRRSAGVLRHRVDDLQVGLKRLSAGLEQLERDGKAAPKKRRARAAVAGKSAPSSRAASPRKQKKAA